LKKSITRLLLGISLLTTSVNANILVDLDIGTGIWYGESSGDINYKTVGTASNIDFKNDLGLKETSNSYFYADFNHILPIVPNLRIEKQNFKTDGNKTLSRTLTFGNETFSTSQRVLTDLKLNQSDFILYWSVPGVKTFSLGQVALNLGLSAKKFDGYARINDELVNVDFTVPMGYLAFDIKFPLIDTKLSASTKVITYKGSAIKDSMIKVSYELPLSNTFVDLNLDVGYKVQEFNITNDLSNDFTADIKNSGLFAGISAKF
jgi:outer membrane protein